MSAITTSPLPISHPTPPPAPSEPPPDQSTEDAAAITTIAHDIWMKRQAKADSISQETIAALAHEIWSGHKDSGVGFSAEDDWHEALVELGISGDADSDWAQAQSEYLAHKNEKSPAAPSIRVGAGL